MIERGNEPIHINMDESPIPRSFGNIRGNRGIKRKRDHVPYRGVERLDHGDQRGQLSFVGFACSNKEFQDCLPMIFLGNEHMLTQELTENIGRLPNGFALWAATSGWMTAQTLKCVFRALHDSVKHLLAKREIILYLDCAKSHIGLAQSASAAMFGITLVYVPSRLTFLLQPLDVYIFARYKCQLRRSYTRRRCMTARGTITKHEWIHLVIDTAVAVFRGVDFAAVFARCGVTFDQGLLNDQIVSYLQPLDITVFRECESIEDADIKYLGGGGITMAFTHIRTSLTSREVLPDLLALGDVVGRPPRHALDDEQESPSSLDSMQVWEEWPQVVRWKSPPRSRIMTRSRTICSALAKQMKKELKEEPLKVEMKSEAMEEESQLKLENLVEPKQEPREARKKRPKAKAKSKSTAQAASSACGSTHEMQTRSRTR